MTIHNTLYYAHTTWRQQIMNENKITFISRKVIFTRTITL